MQAAEAVEVMMVNSAVFKDIQLSTKAFAKIVNLRLLQMDNVHLKGKFEYLPNKLKWLCWKHCPLKYVPCDFQLKTLVALDMSESKFEEFYASLKFLRSLKAMNLNSCKYLIRTPDFAGAVSLERLSFENCSSLTEVQSSIGDLNKLVQLNLLWCIKLEKLPNSISKLKSLDTLILNWCVTMQELPDDLGNLESLRKFSAPRTAVTYLPPSLGCLKNFEYMHMGGFGRSVPSMASQESIGFLLPSITNLCSLNKLCLASCDLSEEDIPSTLGQLTSLEYLDLSKNNCSNLPFSLFQLSKLSELRLLHCKNLQQLPELPPNLERFYIEGCASMEKLPALSQLSKLVEVRLQGCRNFRTLPELPANIERLNLEGCTSLEELPDLSQLSELFELKLKGCRRLQTLPELPQHLSPCHCRQIVDQWRN